MTENIPDFFHPVRVRYYETDLQGHLNFIWHQAYFAMAIAEFLKQIDFSYEQMNTAGIDMLFVDAHSSFHGPAYYDEQLNVHCRIETVGSTSVRFAMTTVAPKEQRLVSTGDMTVVFISRSDGQKTRVPAPVRQAADRAADS